MQVNGLTSNIAPIFMTQKVGFIFSPSRLYLVINGSGVDILTEIIISAIVSMQTMSGLMAWH